MALTTLAFPGADTVDARVELEQRRRPRVDKRMSAAEAVREFVADGDTIAVGGTNHARTPMALLAEVLRQGRRDLSLARPLTCFESELFIATGMASKVITSWVGIGHGWGLARVLREYVESGQVGYEEWSHLGLGLRYKAGAMGVPFLPSYTMMGSDLGRRLELAGVDCPYTGQTLYAVPSLNPDVALIHVQRADVFGNAQIDGYELMDADVARAARRLVISAEAIVPTDTLRLDPAADDHSRVRRGCGRAAADGRLPARVLRPLPRRRRSLPCLHGPRACDRFGGGPGVRRELVAHPDHDAFMETVAPERLERLTADAEGMMPQ